MADLEDFQSFGDKCERELDKIDRHHPDDRPHVKRFAQRLDGRVTEGTLAEYLKNLRTTARRLDDDQAIIGLSEDDMHEHVFDLRRSPEYGQGPEPGLSDGTIRNCEFIVRKFLREIDVDGTGWADDYELTKPPDNRIEPEDMLRADDINALIDGANNMRDIAIIEFLADTGARLSLLGSLRVGDVNLQGERATYRPNPNASGLKGAAITDYPIIDSKATLRTYVVQIHPFPEDTDAAFFHKIPGHGNLTGEEDGALSPANIRKQLRKAAENAGVEKPVNPHNFRHSAVSRMVREGFSRSQIEHRVHWEVDTDMWAVYEHIAGDEHNADIFAHVGIGDGDEETEPERRPCGNCKEPVAPYHSHCPRCYEALTPDAKKAQERAVAALTDEMADAEEMSERKLRAAAVNYVQADARAVDTHDEDTSSSM